MAKLIVIRIVPTQAVDPATFAASLKGLKIEAFDLTFSSPVLGLSVGTASYLDPTSFSGPPSNKPTFDANTGIVQHFLQTVIPGPTTVFTPESVATAVISVNAPTPFENLRVVMTRGADTIPVNQPFYNVNLDNGTPTPDQFEGLSITSFYLELPLVPASGSSVTVTLPADGNAPAFDDVVAAMTAILGIDPGGALPDFGSLDANQCANIASEILWSSQPALPLPPEPLANMFSNPPNDGTTSNTDEQKRLQFEGSLKAYYAPNQADAQRLTKYVFAVAAAFKCQEMSLGTPVPVTQALFELPINAGVTGSGPLSTTQILLVAGGAALPVNVGIPAAYFYALGNTLPVQVNAAQRFGQATGDATPRVLSQLKNAVDAGVINDHEKINGVGPDINPAQAARRLDTLAVTSSTAVVRCTMTPAITQVVNDWLAWKQDWPDATQHTIDEFWTNEANTRASEYLDLVLTALTESYVDPDNNQTLAALVRANLTVTLIQGTPPIAINTVDKLAVALTTDWQAFFQTSPNWPNNHILPPFTGGGAPDDRIKAFIRHVQQFFTVAQPAPPSSFASTDPLTPPTLSVPSNDFIAQVIAVYQGLPGGGPVTLGNGLNANVLAIAAESVFADDPAAQQWLVKALLTLDFLSKIANALPVGGSNPAALRFSIMEALYARGFTDHESTAMPLLDFQTSLIGTVAFDYAPAISAMVGVPGADSSAPDPFGPVNDGTLVNCTPPPCRSPLSPIAYLHQLLDLKTSASCDGLPALPTDQKLTLGELVAQRRGEVGKLTASCANLEIQIPLIDIVNENLEHLVSAATPAGVVFDTDSSNAGGVTLCAPQCCHPAQPSLPTDCQDPTTIYATVPAHSSPAVPVADPTAYSVLADDFSAPTLPYSQPLDVDRSYLHFLKTSRFEAMRHFRRAITEFVHDPALAAPTFQSHLWRYPLRLDLTLEYLCLSEAEFAVITGTDRESQPWKLFGFDARGTRQTMWTTVLSNVGELLRRTGLSYCELIELQNTGVLGLRVGDSKDGKLPACEPCYLDRIPLDFGNASGASLFVIGQIARLWRKVACVAGPALNLTDFVAIGSVLSTLTGNPINADFTRYLVALLILHREFGLPLRAAAPAGNAVGVDRVPLLALWVGPTDPNWPWALEQLLKAVDPYARSHHHCERRSPEFLKLLRDNLDPLSQLAGFDPTIAILSWSANPCSTLRFVEVLCKLYASNFGIGEILYLYSAEPHLDGDDPFPEQSDNEALDQPLDLPEDDSEHALEHLRKKLLATTVDDEAAHSWTWPRMHAAMHSAWGYTHTGASDPFIALGKQFFPRTLKSAGYAVNPEDMRFSVPLAGSQATLWNAPAHGPCTYDAGMSVLSTALPLRDRAVFEKLANSRPLSVSEQQAIQDLYFAPRAALAPFAFLFENFGAAELHLIEEADEHARFAYFQHQFALAHRRSELIAEHLAEHVDAATRLDGGGRRCAEDSSHTTTELAWTVLRSLLADENRSLTPWENDGGHRPAVLWQPQPTGSAFGALLGLTGTGLLGEYQRSGTTRWRELRAPLSAFTETRNHFNAPVPTQFPALDLSLDANALAFMRLRNGFGLLDEDGAVMGGAETFTVRWRGTLLIDCAGPYHFLAGAPTPEGDIPDFEAAEHRQWRVTLQRGQRTWVVLNHQWIDEDEHARPKLDLLRGAYSVTIEFIQPVTPPDDHCDHPRFHSGFTVKYSGPDSAEKWESLPLRALYQPPKSATLADKLDLPKGSQAEAYLSNLYASSLRDIRRTYQRAFKATLLAARFKLHAELTADGTQSELGYLLAHPDRFAGLAYYKKGGSYQPHAADFDFNLLPLRDNYFPPVSTQDDRVQPSAQRSQAFFDAWERLFDYTNMRRATREVRDRPAWWLFYDADQQQPADPSLILRHIGVDLDHYPAVLALFDADANSLFTIDWTGLTDDRYTVRVWHNERWMEHLSHVFAAKDIADAAPALWASDDPSVVVPGATASGLANLIGFVQAGEYEQALPRRYLALQRLNDGLRERARNALVTYLTRANRVALPWGGFATEPTDLSDLLLLDVEAGLCEKTTRIAEAISAIQAYIRRARLGLESSWPVTAAFAQFWDRQFGTFHLWLRCTERHLYRENWIVHSERAKAERIAAFQLLTDRLRRNALSIAVPGGLEWWPQPAFPPMAPLAPIQRQEPTQLHRVQPPREGFDLQGIPERAARLSWLAPLGSQPQPRGNGRDGGNGNNQQPNDAAGVPVARLVREAANQGATSPMPFWVEAAEKLGGHFLRIAAAGQPLASHPFTPAESANTCCSCCRETHPALIDEYYFWLEPASIYLEPTNTGLAGTDLEPHDFAAGFQNDFYDNSEQKAVLWQSTDQLPQLLHWPAKPAVRLAWTRIHNGEWQPIRRSIDALLVTDLTQADLVFDGRVADSLMFEVSAAALAPAGYNDPSAPGFRYDLADDAAEKLPLLNAPTAPLFPAGLPAYPFFVFADPGASLYPTSLYSPVFAVAATLRAHCRYELALRWLQLFYDPLQNNNLWVRCGSREESNVGRGRNANREVNLARINTGVANEQGCCNTGLVSDEVARDRSVALETLDLLIEWSDAELRKGNTEAFQQARLLLSSAQRLLGDRPPTVLSEDLGGAVSVSQFSPDFAPINPRLLALYDTVSDRLDVIRRCENDRRLHNGRLDCDMPYFGNRGDCDPCADLALGCDWPSPYRFEYLIEKAMSLNARARELGAQLLSAFEKGDAAHLEVLRERFNSEVMTLNRGVRQDQWRDADWQIEALQKTKSTHQTNLVYYTNLVNRGLIPDETQYRDLTTTAMVTRAAGNIVEAIGGAMKVIPDLFVGFPCNEAQLPVGTKLAGIFESAARIILTAADVQSTIAGLDLTNAGWERRNDDWIHQTQILPIQIHETELQILGAQRRRDQALQEINIQQRQIEQSSETLDFARDKFTSESLYLYLQKETSAQYFTVYELALRSAHQAQHALNVVLGHTHHDFIPHVTWNSLKEGLLAGEKIDIALQRLQKTFIDRNLREYELTKHFSLRMHLPQAYLQLRALGYCEFELPEWMFDADYPGMYMRRIKSVSLTMPCVTGPYTGVHSKLTLLSSATRIDPSLTPPEHRCCDNRSGRCDYESCVDDPRFIRQYAAREAIATSNGQNDSGLFEFNFRDERFLPFEYQGAVSRWRLEVPRENNAFDLDTLSDVLLHMNFTAREGGEALRCEAQRCAQKHVPGNGWSLFEVRHDFPSSWSKLTAPACESPHDLDIDLHRDLFPFVPGSPAIEVTDLAVLFETCEPLPAAEHCVEWAWLKPDCGGDDVTYLDVPSFASAEWPCLYHGVLALPPRHLEHDSKQPTRIRFKVRHGRFKRVFILYRYRAVTSEACCHTPPIEPCTEHTHCDCHAPLAGALC